MDKTFFSLFTIMLRKRIITYMQNKKEEKNEQNN